MRWTLLFESGRVRGFSDPSSCGVAHLTLSGVSAFEVLEEFPSTLGLERRCTILAGSGVSIIVDRTCNSFMLSAAATQ